MPGRFILVVSLWVKDGDSVAFECFEQQAAQAMAHFGGRIERAIRVDQLSVADCASNNEAPFEIHIVSFPTRDDFDRYLSSAEALALQAQRNRVIAKSMFVTGFDCAPYGVMCN